MPCYDPRDYPERIPAIESESQRLVQKYVETLDEIEEICSSVVAAGNLPPSGSRPYISSKALGQRILDLVHEKWHGQFDGS
jgi:hypothetical protein